MNSVQRFLLMVSFFWMTFSLCLAQTNKLTNTGNAGIGTTTPTTLLEIKKAAEANAGEKLLKLSITDSPVDYFSIENATGANSRFIPMVTSRKESDNRFALLISGNIGAGDMDYGNYAVVSFDARLENGKVNQRPLFVWQSYQSQYMTMLANGNLGIGTINPQAKLAVDGNILATEVKVKTNIAVPDYVFEPDYELAALTDIEAFVKKHKHLPDIPSAKDIDRNGLDLAEMNLLLLKKVEELTLYIIDQQRQLNNLKEQNGKQQEEIDQLNQK